MHCIAVANHKGGVGKSTIVQNVGALLAERGRRILLIDLDPQATLSQAFGIEDDDRNMASVMGGAEEGIYQLEDIIRALGERLDLAPSDISLAAAELGLIGRVGRENVLKRSLGPVRGRYDVILIDCPPTLGILTINALNASTGVLIPTQPQVADLRGLKLFLQTLDQLRRGLDRPDLAIVGVVPTFYDSRYIHHRDGLEAMERGGLPLMTPIGKTVKLAESVGAEMPLHQYEPNNPQVGALTALAEQVETWLEKNPK